MALQPQKTRPASTNFTRLRVGPNRIPKDRSLPAMCAPYPADKSTNSSNNNVQAIDNVMQATYSPAAAPAQSATIAANSMGTWTITSGEAGRSPDFLPGDVLEFLSQDNVNAGTVDALTNSGLYILAVYVTGSGPYDLVAIVYNSTAGGLKTPAGYIPTLIWTRYTNLSSDPNAIY